MAETNPMDSPKKNIFLLLAGIGLIVPYYFFAQFILTHGFDLSLILGGMAGTDMGKFVEADVLLTGLTLVIISVLNFNLSKYWKIVVIGTVIAPSFGLPLMFYLREMEKIRF